MNRNDRSRRRETRVGLVVSAGVVIVLAVLAFVAAMSNTFKWKGRWVVAILVSLAALTLVWKLWTDILRPEPDRRHSQAMLPA